MTTLYITLSLPYHFISISHVFRYLPREVDPLVYNMSMEDPGDINYNQVGGLGEQVRELREVIELPLINPELFQVSDNYLRGKKYSLEFW